MIDTAKLRDSIGAPAAYMTHWDGCIYEKEHARCAVLALCDEVDRLRAELDNQRALIGRSAEAIFGEYHDMRKENERMTAEIAARRWISVDERLPEPCSSILVYFADGTIDRAIFNKHNFYPDADGGYYFDQPTHWMPLPEPPEVE